MLTPVERVLILKGADLLRDAGPRQLLRLADVAREVEISSGDFIYREDDPADALYMLVDGRVRLETNGKVTSEVGPGEAFGTWALIDDSERGHRAVCREDGLALALHREEFYEVAAADLTLLQQVVRALARRLRALVSERPEEARVEGEGIEEPQAMSDPAAPASDVGPPPATAGAALEAAVLGEPIPDAGALLPPASETLPAAGALSPPAPDGSPTPEELANSTYLEPPAPPGT